MAFRVVTFYSFFRSCHRAKCNRWIMSNPKLFCTASMPATRKNRVKGNEIELVVDLASQGRQ